MHTGHFLASRRNSIMFEEDNVAPQCASCNYHANNSAPQRFRQWMEAVRGDEVIKRLERIKNTTVCFTLDELVEKRIEFERRLKFAKHLILKGEES
jgi:hypothetical protein